MNKKKIGAYLSLLGAVFLFASIEISMKLIQGNTSPLLMNFFRFAIGGITLGIYAILSKKTQSIQKLIHSYPKYYIPASLIGLFGGMFLFTYGTTLTTAPLSAVIISSNPLMISTYMILFQGEKRTTSKIAGIILGFIGMVIIITEFNFSQFLNSDLLLGNVLVLLGTLLWVVDLIIGKILMKKSREDPAISDVQPTSDLQSTSEVQSPTEVQKQTPISSLDYNVVTFLVASLAMLPFLFTLDQLEIILHHSWETWAGLLYLGIFTTGFGYLLFFKGLEGLEASQGSNIFYFKPIFTIGLSFILFSSLPAFSFYIGFAIEIIAIILISKK